MTRLRKIELSKIRADANIQPRERVCEETAKGQSKFPSAERFQDWMYEKAASAGRAVEMIEKLVTKPMEDEMESTQLVTTEPTAALEMFEFEGTSLRTVTVDDETWIVARDVATCLGYAKPQNAVTTHCKGTLLQGIPTPGGTQDMLVIQRPDIYRLVGRSDLPGAARFQDWIYEEVLPSIDKHGVYMTPQKIEEVLLSPDTIIKLAQNLKAEQEARAEAEAALEVEKQTTSVLTEENESLQPDAQFGRDLQNCDGLLTATEVAKPLHIGAPTLNRFLRDMAVIYRVGKSWVPYYRFEGKGLFGITSCVPNGSTKTKGLLKITYYGRKYIHDLWWSGRGAAWCAGHGVKQGFRRAETCPV